MTTDPTPTPTAPASSPSVGEVLEMLIEFVEASRALDAAEAHVRSGATFAPSELRDPIARRYLANAALEALDPPHIRTLAHPQPALQPESAGTAFAPTHHIALEAGEGVTLPAGRLRLVSAGEGVAALEFEAGEPQPAAAAAPADAGLRAGSLLSARETVAASRDCARWLRAEDERQAARWSLGGQSGPFAVAAEGLEARAERLELLATPAPQQAEAATDEWANIPPDIVDIVTLIGPAQWCHTDPFDAAGHGENTARSVRLTAEAFGQGDEPRPMQMLTREGTDIVIGYIGTSPHSPLIASALAGAWNLLHQHCAAQAADAQAQGGGSGMERFHVDGMSDAALEARGGEGSG